jgi:hypothetical protein
MRHLITLSAAASLLLVTACTTPDVNTGTVSNASGGAVPAAGQEQPAAPTWGQRYTWKNGLAVEIPQPAECKPGESASPEAKRAVKVTVKVTNGTDKPFETSVLTVGSEVQFAGAKAELLIDSEGGCKAGIGMESATVLPGKSFSYDVAYAVAPEQGELQITLQPDFSEDKAVFTGKA